MSHLWSCTNKCTEHNHYVSHGQTASRSSLKTWPSNNVMKERKKETHSHSFTEERAHTVREHKARKNGSETNVMHKRVCLPTEISSCTTLELAETAAERTCTRSAKGLQKRCDVVAMQVMQAENNKHDWLKCLHKKVTPKEGRNIGHAANCSFNARMWKNASKHCQHFSWDALSAFSALLYWITLWIITCWSSHVSQKWTATMDARQPACQHKHKRDAMQENIIKTIIFLSDNY